MAGRYKDRTDRWDDHEPNLRRQQELEAAYINNCTCGNFPYQGVQITTYGELLWIANQQRWSVAPGSVDDQAHIDLRGANLYEIDLGRTTVHQEDFSYANLSRAYLVRASLARGIFTGTNFSQAIFDEADLTHANLQGANLSYAWLDGADLRFANLRECNLTGTFMSFWKKMRIEGACLPRVEETELAHLRQEIADPATPSQRLDEIGYHWPGCLLLGEIVRAPGISFSGFMLLASHYPTESLENPLVNTFQEIDLAIYAIQLFPSLKEHPNYPLIYRQYEALLQRIERLSID
jgi:Pentapeptide repeats (8 copies)